MVEKVTEMLYIRFHSNSYDIGYLVWASHGSRNSDHHHSLTEDCTETFSQDQKPHFNIWPFCQYICLQKASTSIPLPVSLTHPLQERTSS